MVCRGIPTQLMRADESSGPDRRQRPPSGNEGEPIRTVADWWQVDNREEQI